ncbi:MAG: GreA/GreB family elongation factor [Candidatus Andersenbacteria bacterium]
MRSLKLQQIDIGSRVTLVVNGNTYIWDVVSPGKTSLDEGKVSLDAPLIQLVFGFKEGQKIRSIIGKKKFVVEIKKVTESPR